MTQKELMVEIITECFKRGLLNVDDFVRTIYAIEHEVSE